MPFDGIEYRGSSLIYPGQTRPTAQCSSSVLSTTLRTAYMVCRQPVLLHCGTYAVDHKDFPANSYAGSSTSALDICSAHLYIVAHTTHLTYTGKIMYQAIVDDTISWRITSTLGGNTDTESWNSKGIKSEPWGGEPAPPYYEIVSASQVYDEPGVLSISGGVEFSNISPPGTATIRVETKTVESSTKIRPIAMAIMGECQG